MPPLCKGWLLTISNRMFSPPPISKSTTNPETAKFEEKFRPLRETYLPETILAYIRVLEFAGRILTRDFLMECMDMAGAIADEESDLLTVFTDTGRIQELVRVLTYASKTLLLISSAKSSAASRSKKLRAKGWTHELWSVRERAAQQEN